MGSLSFCLGKKQTVVKAKATHRSTLSILMVFLVMTCSVYLMVLVDSLSVVRRHTCCIVAFLVVNAIDIILYTVNAI